MLKKYIGDKDFYKKVFSIMTPILIQNLVSNFVNLLDNLMVGRVGTEQMSGVSIVNQFLFILNLGIFGLMAGIGIMTAQYQGKKDQEGIRYTLRIKLIGAGVLVAAAYIILFLKSDDLINSFLHDTDGTFDLEKTFGYAKDYLGVMFWGLIPFGLTQAYSLTLRETDQVRVPMIAGITAVVVNTGLNYVLIFGKLGLPVMGVKGAAIATDISRFVECAMVMGWSHTHTDKVPYMKGLYKGFYIPQELFAKTIKMAMPLFMNEFLWSSAMTSINQNLSYGGIVAVSALNIQSTISNLFIAVSIAMGNTIGIIVGQILGRGDFDEAVDEDRKMIALSGAMHIGIGAIMFLVAPYIAMLYNTTDSVKLLASQLIRVFAVILPFDSIVSGCYFTMRSGGKTVITFLFDCCYTWVVMFSVTYLMVHFTSASTVVVYACEQATLIPKLVIGLVLLKKRKWVNNLVQD